MHYLALEVLEATKRKIKQFEILESEGEYDA